MAIIKKYNKANNTTYVYDSVSYWDKELKQPRSKRKLIGKLDPITGEIVPTAGRGKRARKDDDTSQNSAANPKSYSADVPNEEGKAMGESPDLSTTADIRALYEDCRRKLLETEAALAKAQSTVASLMSERQQIQAQIEQILRQLRH